MVDTPWISVEEAAQRLGVSVASVRRKCASDELSSQKVGRSWLVDAAALPLRSPRRSASLSPGASSAVDLVTALKHLLRKDTVWAPDVLALQDEIGDREALFTLAASKLDLLVDFDPAVAVAVPKSPLFVRQGSDLTLSDRLAYQAVVQEIEKYVDPRLSDRVYAARTRDKNRKFKRGSTQPWLNWKTDAYKAAEACDGWTIKTDITAYFDFIEHDRLMVLLHEAQVPELLLRPLRAMLRTWPSVQGRGLPQGPDASRVLANYYLVEVDDATEALGDIEYFRFMDDVRIVSRSRAQATRALQNFGYLAYQIGLPLSTQKTQAMGLSEARADLVDDELDALAYDFDVTPEQDSREVRQRLSKLFESAIPSQGSGQMNARRARFSIYRLFRRRDKQVLPSVLHNLENLGSLERLVPMYLSHWVADALVVDRIADFLEASERNTSDYLASWMFATLLEHPETINERVISFARKIARDRNCVSYLRAVAINVMVLSHRTSDVHLIENIINGEYDPIVVRACVVALHRVGKLSKPIRSRVERRKGYDSLLKFLGGQRKLPSLVFSGQAVASE